MTVLVVEDEKDLSIMIQDYFGTLGWQTLYAGNGSQALDVFRESSVDFILMDIMMPNLDGLDVLRRIREISGVPVILLTARAQESDKLIGLELGADDYVVKPFSLKEVAARIRTVMRRSSLPGKSQDEEIPQENGKMRVGTLELDPDRHTVKRNGQVIELTSVQFDILKGFMRNPGRVFSRMDILSFFYEHADEGYERTIDVHIKNIRKIIEYDRNNPEFLLTVRGVGYKMADPETL